MRSPRENVKTLIEERTEVISLPRAFGHFPFIKVEHGIGIIPGLEG